MTLPATIDAGNIVWGKNATHGPYEVGGALYVACAFSGGGDIRVHKSTDGGNTWTEQDTANRPATNNTSIASTLSGTSIVIAYSDTSSQARIIEFATSTDTFGTASAAGATANLWRHILGNSLFILSVAKRSDGSYIVVYSGNTETVMGTARRRVKLARLASGVWTSDVDVAGTGSAVDFDFRAMVLGTSDRIHIFYTATASTSNATTPTIGLNTRTYKSTNAFDATAATNIDSTVSEAANYACGLPCLNGSEIVVPYVDATGAPGLRVARATSADTPSWSTQAVSATSGTNPESANSNPGAVAVSNGIVYALWPDDTSQNLYADADAGSGSWGADTLFSSPTCNGIGIGAISGGIGLVYVDGSAVKFDIFGAGPLPPYPPVQNAVYRM